MRLTTSSLDAEERASSVLLSRSASDGDAITADEVPLTSGGAARSSSAPEPESERPRRKWKRYRRVLGPDDEFEVMMAAMSYVEVKRVDNLPEVHSILSSEGSRMEESQPRSGAKRGTRRASLELAHALDCPATAAQLDSQVPGGVSARTFVQRVRFQDDAATDGGDEQTTERIPGKEGTAAMADCAEGGDSGDAGNSAEQSTTPDRGDARGAPEQRAPAAPDNAAAAHPPAEALPPHVEHAPDPAAVHSPSHPHALCSPTRG
ncbi:hypothetical protein T484DRAFT_1860547 [Baffinella frigidus]|nr:hypothetical protein T484DRAFT_1860547 [Cryptophyta sp. CCMP2293]